jgi:Leucine-rich repeat (LRR) protein
LGLEENELFGMIPVSIGNLARLEFLYLTSNIRDLSNNQLTGRITKSIQYLINLEDLKLNDNQLSGTIPQELAALPKLNYL